MSNQKNFQQALPLWLLLMLALAFIQGSTIAGQVIIKGKIPGAEGQELYLTAKIDYISYADTLLDKISIDSLGNFESELNLDQVTFVNFQLNYYRFSLYLENEGAYEIITDTADFDNEFRPFYNKEPLGFDLVKEPSGRLNFQIDQFEKEYANFILENYRGVRMNRNINPIKNLLKKLDSVHADNQQGFLHLYKKYRLAGLILTINPFSKLRLFDDFVFDKYYYYQPVFMQFIQSFFQDHLTENRSIKPIDLQSTINYIPDYFALTDSLGKDTLLRNEKLRDLVTLISMQRLYYSKDFSKQGILHILEQQAQKSKFTQHRQIAKKLIAELSHLKTGTSIQNFNLETFEGESENLINHNGKPYYIGFLTTSSFACLGEYQHFDSIYRELGSKVNFITVSLDVDQQKWSRYMKEKKFTWESFYNGTAWPVINYFRIKTFPVFLLLDPQGSVLEYPARKPSENVKFTLQKLVVENNQ